MLLYPYDRLFGDLRLSLSGIEIDGQAPGVHVVDLNGDGLDLFLLEKAAWKRLKLVVDVEGPPAGIRDLEQRGVELSMTVVASCGPTNLRQATSMIRSETDPAKWSASLNLDRDAFSGAGEIETLLTGSIDGRDFRTLGSSNAWQLRFDEPALRSIDGSLDARWVHFRSDDALPFLKRYAAESFYVDLTSAAPVVYLNLDFEHLQEMLEDRPRNGADAALHHALRTSIAAKTWMAMFNAALQEMVMSADETDDLAVSLPGDGWQADVVQQILPILYPNRSMDDAVLELVRTARSDDGPNTVQAEATAAIEKLLEVGKIVRRVASTVYGGGIQ